MSSLIAFPDSAAPQDYLAPASGAPRPITVRRIRSPHAPRPLAALVRLDHEHPDSGAADQQAQPDDESLAERPGAERTTTARSHQGKKSITDTVPDEERIAAIAASVGKAAVEVLGGTRPLNQMARWLDSKSFERLQSRAAMVHACRHRTTNGVALRLHRSISVRSTRLCQVRDGAYEVSLVIAEQTRVRAVALRMELRRGNWKITELEIG